MVIKWVTLWCATENGVFELVLESWSLIGLFVQYRLDWRRLNYRMSSNQFQFGNPFQLNFIQWNLEISEVEKRRSTKPNWGYRLFPIHFMINFSKIIKKSEILFLEINLDEAKALIENLQNTVSFFTLVSLKRVEKEISEGCCTSGIWLCHTAFTGRRRNWTRGDLKNE